jgi:hypothetical protein
MPRVHTGNGAGNCVPKHRGPSCAMKKCPEPTSLHRHPCTLPTGQRIFRHMDTSKARHESRSALPNAARDLIFTRSFENVGTAEICQHAGVRKGSLYHFFRRTRRRELRDRSDLAGESELRWRSWDGSSSILALFREAGKWRPTDRAAGTAIRVIPGAARPEPAAKRGRAAGAGPRSPAHAHLVPGRGIVGQR